eukprot:9489626-Pyramimonas_sp.AAC.1
MGIVHNAHRDGPRESWNTVTTAVYNASHANSYTVRITCIHCHDSQTSGTSPGDGRREVRVGVLMYFSSVCKIELLYSFLLTLRVIPPARLEMMPRGVASIREVGSTH